MSDGLKFIRCLTKGFQVMEAANAYCIYLSLIDYCIAQLKVLLHTQFHIAAVNMYVYYRSNLYNNIQVRLTNTCRPRK